MAPDLLGGPRPPWFDVLEWERFTARFAGMVDAEIRADAPTWMRPDWWQRHRDELAARVLEEHQQRTALMAERFGPAALDDLAVECLAQPPRTPPRRPLRRLIRATDDQITTARRRRVLNAAMAGDYHAGITRPRVRPAAA